VWASFLQPLKHAKSSILADRGLTILLTRGRIITYWVVTAIIVLESLGGGLADILKVPAYVNILEHLGYPAYFAFILGTGKLLAAIAILVSGYPLLKEWAYAGLTIQFLGAIVSHIIVGDPVSGLIAPFIFLCFVVSSWFLRPPSRRIR